MPDALNHPTPAELRQQTDANYAKFTPSQRRQNGCLCLLFVAICAISGWIVFEALRFVWGLVAVWWHP